MATRPANDQRLGGHPRGLAVLFLTEFWERLSYYGMRALLILFMTAPVATGGLGWDDARSGMVYGLYTSGVYLAALPGGWIADRLIGQRHAVFAGGVLICLGHFSLAVPSLATFYSGLVLIVLGTGLLKPNISVMVGQLYPEGDTRRDAGFSIFYMGINLGAFLAPLVCGTLGQRVGWHWGFATAGVGMIAGLIQYVLGRKHLGNIGQLKVSPANPGPLWILTGIGLAATAAVLFTLSSHLHIVIPAALVVLFGYWLSQGETELERRRIGAILILFVFSALFWAAFEQHGSSFNLFADRFTDTTLFGFRFDSTWFQSVNPLIIITFAPAFAWLWSRLGPREPSSPAKFTVGLLLVGLGFLVMVPAARATAVAGVRVSPGWLLTALFLHTMGELCLSPVGLSTVTKLAPTRMLSQMMGVWFLSISLGNYAGGWVASQFGSVPLPELFGAVFLVTTTGAIVLALVAKAISRVMSGVK